MATYSWRFIKQREKQGDKMLTTENTEISQAINEFTWDLYQVLSKDSTENVFFSSASIVTCLAMVLGGAKEETFSVLAESLNLPFSEDQVKELFESFQTWITQYQQKEQNKAETANSLWADLNYELSLKYINALSESFKSEARNIDFSNATNAAKVINSWVSEKTHGMIQDLLSSDVLEQAKFVLANAIYFKGSWLNEFDKNRTRELPFYGLNKQSVAELMYKHCDGIDIKYGEYDNCQILEVPYKGHEFSFVALLPRDFKEFETKISDNFLQTALKSVVGREVIVYLPKFEMEIETDLNTPFSELGAELIFSDNANFSNLLEPARPELKISKILHKAKIKLDEEGTEAAAATAVVGILCCASSFVPPPPPVFRADRPFIFYIRDNATNSIVFAGRVVEL